MKLAHWGEETLRHGQGTREAGSVKVVRLALVVLLFLGNVPLWGADRCADARDDIRRAKVMVGTGQETEARTLLRSAFLACPMNPQNLDLLADAYDSLGELAQAGSYRAQAMRLRGISEKPKVNFTLSATSLERGSTATLNWSTTYATEVDIGPDFGRVAANGTKTVAPTAATTYELTARGPGGVTTASLQIMVTIPRLTETNIVDLLKGDVPKPRIARLAAERGITFELTPDVEKRLRSAGADDALIAALRETRQETKSPTPVSP